MGSTLPAAQTVPRAFRLPLCECAEGTELRCACVSGEAEGRNCVPPVICQNELEGHASQDRVHRRYASTPL